MTVSAKCYYGLRAIYALAEHGGASPMKAGEIAGRQHIPIKFLEAILSQLKGGGYVVSRRGAEGATRWPVLPTVSRSARSSGSSTGQSRRWIA
jgi:Rrf2 family cysteine metabolism transcriptional repressor